MIWPKFDTAQKGTSSGVERRWDLWRVGRWHLKIVWWRSR